MYNFYLLKFKCKQNESLIIVQKFYPLSLKSVKTTYMYIRMYTKDEL